MVAATLLAEAPTRFAGIDWFVIGAYLLLTTLVGARLSGKQATIRDFFLAGRKLPWWAICGSIIATEISAVTFIAVPVISFAEAGNLTYLQWAIGAIAARLIIGFYFVPRYYQREIYSPYDYLEKKLGLGVKKVTTVLFFVGAILGQGARVYVTAFMLSVITDLDLSASIWLIGAFSILWTLLGGMTTVIWTDVIQFCVLLLGAFCALCFAVYDVPGGVSDIVTLASAADKFQIFDGRFNLSLTYTFWVGLLAMPFLNLAAFGTDQVMAQRLFCCRDEKDAKKAIIASSASVLVAVVMLMVGIALYAYFAANPFSAEEQAHYNDKSTYLMPIFIVRALPVGVRGLIAAAVFAAAISSLDSTLAALSQTTLSAFVKPRSAGRRRKQSWLRKALSTDIGLSKALVIAWGIVLCGMATACIFIADRYANAVDLAFALVGYTYGPLLGIFLLAFLPTRRDHSGLFWSVPLSIAAIFGMCQHGDSVRYIHYAAVLCIFVAMVYFEVYRRRPVDMGRVFILTLSAMGVLLLHFLKVGQDAQGNALHPAFVWSYPLGTIITFALGYALGRPKYPTQNARLKGRTAQSRG